MNNSHKLSYVYGLFNGLRMLPGAINIIFLTTTGISLQEVAILQFIFSFCVFILEIPTGLISDYIGRKISVILGFVAMFFYFYFFIKTPNLYYLYSSQILYAFGISCLSGSVEGWLVDIIKTEYPNQLDKIDYFNQLKNEINYWGTMIAGPAGSLIAFYFKNSYRFVYFLCMLGILIFLFFLLKIPEFNKPKNKYIKVNAYLKITLKDILIVLKSKEGREYLFIQGALVGTYQIIFFYWQPYFNNLNKGENLFFIHKELLMGIVFFSYSFTRALFIKISRTKLKNINPFLVSIYCLSLSIISMFFFTSSLNGIYLYIILFSIIQGAISLTSILIESQFIKMIPSDIIPSVLSAINALTRIFAMIVLLFLSKTITDQTLQLFFKGTTLAYLFVIIKTLSLKKLSANNNIKKEIIL